SSHFLNSKYIEAKEFGALIEKFNNTLIIPVYFNHCSITVWDELSKRQFFKPSGKKYGKPAEDDFSFCDIVEFASSEGRFIPFPSSKRDLYFHDLVVKIEESLGHILRAPKIKEASFKTDGKYLNPTNYPYFEKDSFFGRDELLRQIDEK